MQFNSRLQRLEKKLIGDQQGWAVFSINFYEEEGEKRKAQERLLEDYLSAGKPRPTVCIFINEIPGSSKTLEEKFQYCFGNSSATR